MSFGITASVVQTSPSQQWVQPLISSPNIRILRVTLERCKSRMFSNLSRNMSPNMCLSVHEKAYGLDAATSFYLYPRLSQLEGMPFDTANLIAKSMNLDLKLFEKQGLIETWKKGKSQGIKILIYTNRETNPKQSLIDCVQFVMTTFARGGYTEVERELSTITFSRNEIKDVLEALLSLPTEDPERQVAQKILERMGQSFPKQGQTGLDNF